MHVKTKWLVSTLAVAAVSLPFASAADTDVVINEVFYLGNSAAEDWVELKNTGTDTIDVGSWILCARFRYSPDLDTLTILSGDDFILEPGEILVVESWINLNNTSSDIGIYTSRSFGSPTAMVDYMQYGTNTDPGRADVARDKGIWTEFGFNDYDSVPTAAAAQSAAYCGDDSGGGLLTLGTDFSNVGPTLGTENGVDCGMVGGGLMATVSGTCPGPVTVDVTGASGGASVALARGSIMGAAAIPSGSCAGTVLDIGDPQLLIVTTADAAGNAVAMGNAPAILCGALLQAVDLTTCEVSNLTSFP